MSGYCLSLLLIFQQVTRLSGEPSCKAKRSDIFREGLGGKAPTRRWKTSTSGESSETSTASGGLCLGATDQADRGKVTQRTEEIDAIFNGGYSRAATYLAGGRTPAEASPTRLNPAQ